MPDQEYSQAQIADMLSAPIAPLTAADVVNASNPDGKLVATAIVPTDAEVEAVVAYFGLLRSSLTQRVADIETMLGFIDVEGDLAVRVGKLEHFTGIKR